MSFTRHLKHCPPTHTHIFFSQSWGLTHIQVHFCWVAFLCTHRGKDITEKSSPGSCDTLNRLCWLECGIRTGFWSVSTSLLQFLHSHSELRALHYIYVCPISNHCRRHLYQELARCLSSSLHTCCNLLPLSLCEKFIFYKLKFLSPKLE